MLQGFSSLSSGGTGVVSAFIPFDPSSTGFGFAEWADIAALYSEVKHVATEIQISPYNAAETLGTPLYIGYRFDSAVNPASAAAVLQLASCRFYNVIRDTTSRSFRMIAKAKPPLSWSLTSTVTTAPYAGCPGSFQFYGSNYAPSIVIAQVRVKGIYLVRGRI
jgi:hypothetical protein